MLVGRILILVRRFGLLDEQARREAHASTRERPRGRMHACKGGDPIGAALVVFEARPAASRAPAMPSSHSSVRARPSRLVY
jgi:hypothetical protein